MKHDFSGKAVLVTGAASGLGKAAAEAFHAAGAKVLLVDVQPAVAEVAAALGERATALQADLSQFENCGKAVDAAIAAFGRLDTLCNVAGVAWMDHVADWTPERWHRMIDINLGSVFFLSQAALPHLLDAQGSIVNIASSAGTQGQAYMVPYSASKAGVIAMTKAMAMEFMHQPVRINAIAPAGMRTPMATGGVVVPPEGASIDLITRYHGFRNMSEPESVAETILFLASDSAAFIHGTCVSVDQGQLAG